MASQVDGHAVVRCGQFGTGEPAERAGGHVGEHDPLSADLTQVDPKRLIIQVVADRPVEGVGLSGEQIRPAGASASTRVHCVSPE